MGVNFSLIMKRHLTCKTCPSLHAISPLEESLCHCLELQVAHRRLGPMFQNDQVLP